MDKIILLDEGNISMIGTHSELMDTSEYYKNLVNTGEEMLL